MTADQAVIAVLRALEAIGAMYMIVGSLASNVHGIPRSTRDADIVIDPAPDLLVRLKHALPPELMLDPQTSFETVTGTVRSVIALSGTPFVCELFELSDDAHDRERFQRRVRIRLLGQDTWVATAEDMIIMKLRWGTTAGRAKDLDDVRNMLAVRSDELDWVYIERWCDIHGTLARLAEIRASIPPE